MNKTYKHVSDIAALHDITEAPLRPQCQKRMPKQLDDTIVMEITGTRNTVENTHNSETLEVCLYYPVLDAIIAEL